MNSRYRSRSEGNSISTTSYEEILSEKGAKTRIGFSCIRWKVGPFDLIIVKLNRRIRNVFCTQNYRNTERGISKLPYLVKYLNNVLKKKPYPTS